MTATWTMNVYFIFNHLFCLLESAWRPWILTSTLSLTFIACVLTSRVTACALDVVLWREHLMGKAAMVAKSKYSGQKSVGDGCKHVMAFWNVSSVTREPNLIFTSSNLSTDKWRSWPIINTGWFCGSVAVNALLNLSTMLLICRQWNGLNSLLNNTVLNICLNLPSKKKCQTIKTNRLKSNTHLQNGILLNKMWLITRGGRLIHTQWPQYLI